MNEEEKVHHSSSFNLAHVVGIMIFIFVIGIVAYPVLQPAHDGGGKKAVSLSNAKQISLAALIYSADFDEYLPLGTSWHTGRNDQLCFPAPAGCFSTWAWSIQPYMKSEGLFLDPLVPPNPRGAKGKDRFDTFHLQYGYNYANLSPFLPAKDVRNSNQRVTGISQSTASNAAQTVMVTSKWARSATPSAETWSTGFPGGMLADAAIDPPDCTGIASLCFGNWGKSGFYDRSDPAKGMLLPEHEGRFMGGVAIRLHQETVVVGLLDGHAAQKTYLALAAGTNWGPGVGASTVVVSDPKKYLWSVAK